MKIKEFQGIRLYVRDYQTPGHHVVLPLVKRIILEKNICFMPIFCKLQAENLSNI